LPYAPATANNTAIGSEHTGITLAAFGDGGVRAINLDIDLNVLLGLCSRAGREPVSIE
jgi:hypothetical protein